MEDEGLELKMYLLAKAAIIKSHWKNSQNTEMYCLTILEAEVWNQVVRRFEFSERCEEEAVPGLSPCLADGLYLCMCLPSIPVCLWVQMFPF